MLVITAGTVEYRDIVRAQAAACARLGYKQQIYDLGGLDMGEPLSVPESDLKPSFNGDSLPPATFKAKLMFDAFRPHACLCWMDADCLPLRDFLPPGNWDAAVTLRPAPEVSQCGISAMDFLNSGVVWIRNVDFARLWWEKSLELNTDQGGLNASVGPDFSPLDWKSSYGKSVWNPWGMRILILDAMDWNCWHLPPRPETRILHFKRGIRAAAKDYCH